MASQFDPSIFTVIRAEDLDAIAEIKAGLIDHYQPANSEELFAIERIALARHSLLRVYRMESGVVTFGIQKALQIPGDPRILQDPEGPGEPPVTRGQKASFWMATGFYEAAKMSVWQFFLRYQAQTERLYRHAIEDFERLRRHRGRIPEQPAVEPAPTRAPEPPAPPNGHVVNSPAVPIPAKPAAPPHRPRRASHHAVPRTIVPPAARSILRPGFPNAP